MRAVFVGNVEFSRRLLLSCLSVTEVDVVGVVTKSKSNFNADQSDLSDIAKSNNIPYKYVANINAPHIIYWLKSLSADIILCFGWSALLKDEVLNITKHGVIGYHPAELPKNRGRHPIIWALALGLDATASSFFKMDGGADTGNLVSQVKVEILQSDTALTLYNKLNKVACRQVVEFLPLIASGEVAYKVQDESQANYWRKRSAADGRIDFRMNTSAIANLVRALTKPYAGAHIDFKGGEVKVWETEYGPHTGNNLEPGKVLDKNGADLLVRTSDSSIWIKGVGEAVDIDIGEYLI